VTYRFEHDPESGAIYVRVRDGEYHETIPLGETGFGAGVDVDAQGNVLGVEFLSFAEYAEVVAAHGGRLELPTRLWTASTPARDHEPLLREALDSLPRRHREVLQLFYFEALSASEVADRLGVPVGTAFRLRRAALKEVRMALEKQESGTVDDAELEAFLSTL